MGRPNIWAALGIPKSPRTVFRAGKEEHRYSRIPNVPTVRASLGLGYWSGGRPLYMKVYVDDIGVTAS